MGWRAAQKSLLLPVAGEFFLLTLPFIERGNRTRVGSAQPTTQELIVRLLRLEVEPAASAVTVPSGTLHITNLHVDSEFVVVAEVDDVVAAATGASGTS